MSGARWKLLLQSRWARWIVVAGTLVKLALLAAALLGGAQQAHADVAPLTSGAGVSSPVQAPADCWR